VILVRWLQNRVILGMVIFFVLVGLWEFRWKPQYKPSYEAGVAAYRAGRYLDAANSLNRAYEIAPNAVDVIMMLGWTELKLNHFEEARFYFNRALKIDPRTEEARIGISFVAIETGRGELDAKLLGKILEGRSGDPNLRVLVAAAMANDGKEYEAARMYRELVNDKHYGKSAKIALEQIYGTEGFENVKLTEALPLVNRPGQMQLRYRASDRRFWREEKGLWAPFYVAGVDLGPGVPGYYPGSPPHDGALYASWLKNAGAMNANVVRVYTLLPPSFYRAYKSMMDAGGGHLALFQQIWIGEPPDRDLYDAKFVTDTKAEIRYVIDAIHGRGEVPPKSTRGSGIYDNDVSANVAGLLLGREIEPTIAIHTNIINLGKKSYSGRYVSIENATATETWFAEMMDYVVAYETQTYNCQHPLALVNWPPMDPLNHPTEASTLEEVKFRVRRGEDLEIPRETQDDADIASIDEAKFKSGADFKAGLFASYHVYPYFPDFLLVDPRYLKARDSVGINPMFGYLQDLRSHIPWPLVISEYGVPTSIGISHFHPYGWHHGGETEDAQAELLTRLTRSIHEAGCAGGIVFELMDEWYKHNWLTVDFENPLDRASLWLNDLDPEKRYGVVGFHTGKWRLFAGDDAAWSTQQRLYSTSKPLRADEPGARLRSADVAIDEGYLYLRLSLSCLDCRTRAARNAKPATPDRAYAVAINTVPRLAGIQQLPFGNITLRSGANFLLYLFDSSSSRLLIADNYNPYHLVPKAGMPRETDLLFRAGYTPFVQPTGQFGEFIVETNRRRFARDGTQFVGQRYSRSVLRNDNGNPQAPDYDSLAEWYSDAKKNSIYVRIPWGKLLMTDPSSRQAYHGFDAAVHVRTITSTDVELSVFELTPGANPADVTNAIVVASYPAARNGHIEQPERVIWKNWETVPLDPYFKKSFYAMQKEFAGMDREVTTTAPHALRAGNGVAQSSGR
jgi:hypothetical protein